METEPTCSRIKSFSNMSRRHELAVMRAVGQLVENDMSGISHQLWTYSSRPWLSELIVETSPPNSQIDINRVPVDGMSKPKSTSVNVVAGRLTTGRSGVTPSTFYYDSVRKHAYHLLKDDVEAGRRAVISRT